MVNNLTSGKPFRVLLAFSLPMLVGNIVQQFYNMVDLIIVGRFVGVNALAAVGATTSMVFLIFSLVLGLTNGASVVVSQYYGYGDMNRMRRTVSVTIYMLAAVAILLTLVGALITKPLLLLLRTPPEILEGAAGYMQVICYGVVATVAYNGLASIIRALGDSLTPLVFLVVAVILNIFLDILFVVGFRMGVAGAAWATVLAQALAALGCFIYAARKIEVLRLKRSDFVLDRAILGQTIRLGIPGGIQNSLVAIGSMGVQSVVNSFGAVVVAAYAASTKIDQLAVQPLLSLSMASATYTAQNMGAGRVDRVQRGFWTAVAMSTVFSVCITVVIFLFGGNLISLFLDTAESPEVTSQVLAVGMQYLRIVSIFYALLGFIILLENVLRGAGDVLVPMFSNAIEIVVRIVLAFVMAAALGYPGIWWTGPIAWSVGTVICAVRYFSGKWQNKVLVGGGTRAADESPPADSSQTEEE